MSKHHVCKLVRSDFDQEKCKYAQIVLKKKKGKKPKVCIKYLVN